LAMAHVHHSHTEKNCVGEFQDLCFLHDHDLLRVSLD